MKALKFAHALALVACLALVVPGAALAANAYDAAQGAKNMSAPKKEATKKMEKKADKKADKKASKKSAQKQKHAPQQDNRVRGG